MDYQEMIFKIREAGVVGAGGAGFPTWRKLECRGEVDTLILNGVECEPLLHADYYCMLHYADKIMESAAQLKDILHLTNLVLALKEKRSAVRNALKKALGSDNLLQIQLLPDVYPSGDEHILVYDITGRIVPQGGIPLDVGVLVQNVQTLIFIHDALQGIPVTRRFISVSGAVNKPFTAEVPVGTPLLKLLDAAGGASCPKPSFLAGGVMMGNLVSSDFTVAKTTSGVLVLPKDNPAVEERTRTLERDLKICASVCDQCYACTELCPRHLIGHDIEPHLLMRRARDVLENSRQTDHIVHYCSECGICSLIACPLKITPRRLIAAMKKKVPAEFRKEKESYSVHPDYPRKKLPMNYVLERLDLARYEQGSHFIGELSNVTRIRMTLEEFGNNPVEPDVDSGIGVIRGEVVARGRHTVFHAPISGIVAAGEERKQNELEIVNA